MLVNVVSVDKIIEKCIEKSLKNEKVSFHEHSFNMDISHASTYKAFKFSQCIHDIQKQGSMSQNVHLGHSFVFMKCRNLYKTK